MFEFRLCWTTVLPCLTVSPDTWVKYLFLYALPCLVMLLVLQPEVRRSSYHNNTLHADKPTHAVRATLSPTTQPIFSLIASCGTNKCNTPLWMLIVEMLVFLWLKIPNMFLFITVKLQKQKFHLIGCTKTQENIKRGSSGSCLGAFGLVLMIIMLV